MGGTRGLGRDSRVALRVEKTRSNGRPHVGGRDDDGGRRGWGGGKARCGQGDTCVCTAAVGGEIVRPVGRRPSSRRVLTLAAQPAQECGRGGDAGRGSVGPQADARRARCAPAPPPCAQLRPRSSPRAHADATPAFLRWALPRPPRAPRPRADGRAQGRLGRARPPPCWPSAGSCSGPP